MPAERDGAPMLKTSCDLGERRDDPTDFAASDPTVTLTLADGTVLPDCRSDLLNIGDLMARGWSVIPLRPRSKAPAVRWEPYQRRLPTLDELESWFTTPGYNVGIVTGELSRLLVVDLDSQAALSWAEQHLPVCHLRVRTAAGCHYYYEYSGARQVRNKTRVQFEGRTLDIDIRGEGGYVVGPGSIHPSGHVYTREGDGWRWL